MSTKHYDINGRYNMIEHLTDLNTVTTEEEIISEEDTECFAKASAGIFSNDCLTQCNQSNGQQSYCNFFQNFKLSQDCEDEAYQGNFSQKCFDTCNSRNGNKPFECNFFTDSQLSTSCINNARKRNFTDTCYNECQDTNKSKSRYCNFFNNKKIENEMEDDKKYVKILYIVVGSLLLVLLIVFLIKFKCENTLYFDEGDTFYDRETLYGNQ